jgi:coproporphyrinogen III oxidase-like Fe-S oxidoreductase
LTTGRAPSSVQSLVEGVLENIKRKNVSADQIMQVAVMGSEIGANTYSEVILGLPGDTKKKHYDTIARLIQSGFNRVETYTLMMLHGSELNELGFSSDWIERQLVLAEPNAVRRTYNHAEYLGDHA